MGSSPEDLRRAIGTHLADRDSVSAVADILAMVDSGSISIPSLYRDVLAPLLSDTGSDWQQGITKVWEEHLATATVRTAVEALFPAVLARRSPDTGETVLLACPPQEQHDLGLRMAADLFALTGCDVVYLGADTPEQEIIDAAEAVGADTVLVSASTHYHRLRLRELVDRLEDSLPGMRIRAMGSAFSHDREGWSDDELLDLDALASDAESSR